MALLSAGGATFETTYARPAEGGEDPTILDRLTQMIDDTPPGAEIRATLFRLTVEPVRDALVAASNRGVAVHVVHNGRDVVSEVAATLSRPAPDGLGDGHRWSGPAYDPTGRRPDFGAVATGRNSDLHTKLVLFSATRDPTGALRRDVSWWSSANPSHHSGMQKANNAIAVYDDPVLYAGFRTRLWDLMWTGTHFPGNDFYDAGRGRGWFLGSPATRTKVFCSPQQSTDLYAGRLASVVVDAGTEVVLAHARFTDDRLAVADELVRIARGGGSVRVLVGTDPTCSARRCASGWWPRGSRCAGPTSTTSWPSPLPARGLAAATQGRAQRLAQPQPGRELDQRRDPGQDLPRRPVRRRAGLARRAALVRRRTGRTPPSRDGR